MRRFLVIFFLLAGSMFCGKVFAQQNCPAVDSVKKWEVISSSQLLAYDQNDKYYFFIYVYGPRIEQGKPVSLRFFSSTICRGDTVVVNGTSTTISYMEGIRRWKSGVLFFCSSLFSGLRTHVPNSLFVTRTGAREFLSLRVLATTQSPVTTVLRPVVAPPMDQPIRYCSQVILQLSLPLPRR